MSLRGNRQISGYLGITVDGWHKLRKRHPDLFGCHDVASHGGRTGYAIAFDPKSLDWARPISASRTQSGRQKAARIRWDQSSGSNC
jgi:hypothetical protein